MDAVHPGPAPAARDGFPPRATRSWLGLAPWLQRRYPWKYPFASVQVEQQYFGLVTVIDDDFGCALDLERVTRAERLAVHLDAATCHVHVGFATLRETVCHFLIAVHQRGIQLRVLMNLDRAVATIRGGEQAQLAALVFRTEEFLLVAGLDAELIRFDPDLQEMNAVLRRRVVLAVGHARTGAHALHIAGPDHRTGAHAVLVFQFAVEHVADDFHVAVRMLAEALSRGNAVFVDHAQRAVSHVLRIVVTGEGERVEALQPAVVGKSALVAFSQGVHLNLHWVSATIGKAFSRCNQYRGGSPGLLAGVFEPVLRIFRMAGRAEIRPGEMAGVKRR